MKLQNWAFGAVFITTIMIGITGFISGGLDTYGVNDTVQDEDLQKLQDLQQETSIDQDAQSLSEQAEARSSFFTLPSIVNLLRLPFDSIPVWESFVATFMQITGLNYAHSNWPFLMFGSFITIMIAYRFASRVL